MKVDIGDKWDMNLLLNLGHGFCGLCVGDGASYQFTTRFFQFMNLFDRGLHVSGVGFGHGLDSYIRSTTYLNATYIDRFGRSTIAHFALSSNLS